jgi:hypothetical protein
MLKHTHSVPFAIAAALALVLSLLALPAPVAAATTVPGGDVSGTWTASGSPYLVEGDLTVPSGEGGDNSIFNHRLRRFHRFFSSVHSIDRRSGDLNHREANPFSTLRACFFFLLTTIWACLICIICTICGSSIRLDQVSHGSDQTNLPSYF